MSSSPAFPSTLKRPFDIYDTPVSSTPPSAKRRHLDTPSSTLKTPLTPYTPYAATPSDSPTNPFGLKRSRSVVRNATLPPATSFKHHMTLRFQLIQPGTAHRPGYSGGIWRISQVPLSYTFRHMHKLLLFLFGGEVPSTSTIHTASVSKRTRSTKPVSKGRIVEKEPTSGHVFSVLRRVQMSGSAYEPGRISGGQTWAKLSSVRDPYRYREEEDEEDENAVQDLNEDDEGKDWRWEAEEDFTLGHVWPHGLDKKRGIIYFHDTTSRIQVHITLNTEKVASKKGTGNKPFVFAAHGYFSLLHPNPLTAPVTTSHSASVRRVGKNTSKTVTTVAWNKPDAFIEFLQRFSKPGIQDDDSDHEVGSTPNRDANNSKNISTGFSDPFVLITPFPTRPLHKLRVEHAHRRLQRLTKSIMQLKGSDEEETEEDELANDVDEGDKSTAAETQQQSSDPFGDEAEV